MRIEIVEEPKRKRIKKEAPRVVESEPAPAPSPSESIAPIETSERLPSGDSQKIRKVRKEIEEELETKKENKELLLKEQELNDLKRTQKELKSYIKNLKDDFTALFESEVILLNWANWLLRKTPDGKPKYDDMKEDIAFAEKELSATEERIKEIKKEIKEIETI